MSHHRIAHLPLKTRRRLLFWLTTLTSILIIILWALYLNATLTLPSPDAPPKPSTSSIFKTGFSVIARTIESGFINSYLFFHGALTRERVIMIER